MIKTKQAAEERRMAMRRMMREKKRIASLSALDDDKENTECCMATISVETKTSDGSAVTTLTDGIN